MGWFGVGPRRGALRQLLNFGFAIACAVAAAVTVPKGALAQLAPSSCSNAPTNATTCFTGTQTNVPIEETTTGSGGAGANGWNVYSNANLTNTTTSILRLIDISSTGGAGDSSSPNGGSGGAVTVRNDGALTWTVSNSPPFFLGSPVVFSVAAKGGNGYTPSNHDYGGVGGASSSQALSVTNTGAIQVSGTANFGMTALQASTVAGNGGNADDGSINYYGGNGGNAAAINLSNSGTISLGTAGSFLTGKIFALGIDVVNQGGNGGGGSCSNYGACPNGNVNYAGNGGTSGTISINNTAPISVYWAPQPSIYPKGVLSGISAYTIGGTGADSQNNYSSGGFGGNAGGIYLTNTQNITLSSSGTTAVEGAAIFAQARGGQGGTGNKEDSSGNGVGGNGGAVPQAVLVSLPDGGQQAVSVYASHGASGLVSTTGNNLAGIVALARGGAGGAGGSNYSANNSSGGIGGAAGLAMVEVLNNAQVSTAGQSSLGVFAQSIGGVGGNGGNDGGLVGQNGGAGMGGAAGGAAVTTAAGTRVQTTGDFSVGIAVQSIGGGGGSGSDFVSVLGGQGGQGGRGGDACANPGSSGCAAVFNTGIKALGTVITSGSFSYGLLAQSIGGAGGTGGIGDGLVYSLGGDGGAGGAASGVTVTSGETVQVHGYGSHGVLAQSIGGGGGAGGVSSGALSIGGNGATDYTAVGGQVMVTQQGLVQTFGDAAIGILAQSIGGGGGSGAGSSGIISVGGKGSAGGAGGSVQVQVNGGVNTAGSYSYGVVAQSIGGGGGSGGNVLDFGFGVPTVGVGGSSAGGGAGGAVTIDFGGSVVAGGDHGAGLVAQSIGGGGGTGGDVTGLGVLAFTTLTIGGGASNASGGAGGTVTIDTSGAGARTVQTAGAYGVGVLAQSIGGGGGIGGNASGYNASIDFATSVSVGGSAGGGGNGGSVTVNWQGGSITTGANMRALSTAPNQPIPLTGQAGNAYGLVAQSIGGGGGSGGSSSVDQLVFSLPSEAVPLPTVNLTASVGGSAGAGGTGGVVNVGLSGTSIVTWGGGAHGVLAQSIGGGGGTGGDASALSVAAAIPDTNELPTVSLSFALGASGGVGGSAQTVNANVDGKSVLTTYGDNANAVVAQSIGGGGGDGGVGSAATYTLFEGSSLKTALGLGGKGGSGGDGGEVNVTVGPGSILNTVGSGSRGVVAQSIGGGGGTSQGGTAGLAVGSFVGTVQVGRTGGGGGNGGTVNVTSGGLITTMAKDGDGILAQSIGGGGGLGGTFGADGSWDNPNWINVIWDVQRVIKTLTDQGGGYSMTVTVGGKGGAGGQGGAVNINNAGGIGTAGDWADGIVAQSVGGGGGAGGTAVADGSQQTASVNVGVGGQGGAAGNGGAITIQNAGLISTQGFSAYGLLAQSIGGGGGQGGDGSAKSTGRITIGGGAGGGGGASGQGGMVQLLDTAVDTIVSTKGAYAHGMVLQSIGGGGGLGGSGNSTTPAAFQNQGFDIIVGGSGGSSGNGCAVTVGGATPNSNNCQVTATGEGATVLIQTRGQGAYGLLAQSIGGGGGVGGAANASQITSVAVGGSGGSSGNGGMVNLYLANSQIVTAGFGAHAIVAQSIGGGGGIGGDPSGSPLAFGGPTPGTGGSGNGGNVTVVTGTKTIATGDYAFGVLAQSIGGGGGLSGSASGVSAGSNGGANSVSSDVSVTANGVLSATGNNAIGIFAQSAASGGAGAVIVTVNGSVTGGSGTQGAGVHIDGGNADNAVTVGQQGSVSALSGTAIAYTGNYAPVVTGNGTIQGNVLLRSDLGALGRLSNGGTLIAGSLLDADVTNSGRLSVVHSSSAFATTVITGNFTQSSTGSTIIGADLTAGTSDRLQISGSATLDGRIGFNLRSIRPNQSVVVLTAGGGITGQLTPDNGPGLFTFQLQQTGTAVSVSAVGANLASPSFGLNASQTAIARGLQDIWNAGGGTFDTLFATLQGLAAGGGYADALSKLSPGVTLASAARSRDNVQEFSNNLMSCPVFENDTALVGETECTWARIGGRLTNQSASGGVAGYNNSLMTYQLGTQWAIAPDWFLGGSIAYQQSWLAGNDGRVNTTGNGGSVGLALKRQAGPWLFAASLGGSVGWYDTKRLIAIPGLASVAYGSSSVISGQGRLRGAYSFVFQDWYVRPYADFDVIHVRAPGYSESGAGALGLTYDTASQWTIAFSPTVEVGGRMNLANGYVLRPYASVGISAFSNTEWTTTSRLQGGLGAGTFTSSLATDPVVARTGAGLQLMAQNGFDFRLTYDGAFSEHTISNALSLRAALRF